MLRNVISICKALYEQWLFFLPLLIFWLSRVDDKLTVKLSDSALSRDLFPDDYHWMGEAESRPVKWMPPEVILQPRASAPADMVILLLIPILITLSVSVSPRGSQDSFSMYINFRDTVI